MAGRYKQNALNLWERSIELSHLQANETIFAISCVGSSFNQLLGTKTKMRFEDTGNYLYLYSNNE
jgi:hypothetical protein